MVAPKSELAWKIYFDEVRVIVRGRFHSRFPFKNDGDVSPDIVALRDGFHKFPCKIQILEIDASGSENQFNNENVWTLVRHDLDGPQHPLVTFYGQTPFTDLNSRDQLIMEVFGQDGLTTPEFIKELRPFSCSLEDLGSIVEFVPFRVADDAVRYGNHLFDSLLMFYSEPIIRRFKDEINFNELYKLPADPVLSREDLLRIHPITGHFVSVESGKPPDITDRDRAVAEIQLIPKVPADVRRTFEVAKRLYVYGFLEYGFFTVSKHYAYLAIEAAILNRWSLSLGQDVNVECDSVTTRMQWPSYYGLRQISKANGWKLSRVFVDGKKLPLTMREVLDALERKAIITRWHRSRLEIGLELRNSLSHLESAQIHTPSSNALKSVAEQVNLLFHSVP